MLEDILNNPKLKYWLKKLSNNLDESDDDDDNDYEVLTNHQGPALNVSIVKKSSDLLKNVVCMKNKRDDGKAEDKQLLDVDFTFALYCPKFPQAGKCKILYVSFFTSFSTLLYLDCQLFENYFPCFSVTLLLTQFPYPY